MLNRIVENLKTAPSRLSERGHAARKRATQRVTRAKLNGEEAIWAFQIDALEKVGGLLESAPDLPVVSTVTGAAERLVNKGLESVTALPIDDYDSLNTRKVSDAVRQLSRVDLLRVRRYEEANKNRKTALAAVDRELERYERSATTAAA